MIRKDITIYLLLTTVLVLLFFAVSIAQTKMKNDQNALEGKTFVVQLYEYSPDGRKTGTPLQDELTFVGGKLSSKVMSKGHLFIPGRYSIKVDSSSIAFAAENLNEPNGEVIFWLGTVKADTIEGTMKWFAKGKTKLFLGVLKYKDEEK